jgi:hypothetical protein
MPHSTPHSQALRLRRRDQCLGCPRDGELRRPGRKPGADNPSGHRPPAKVSRVSDEQGVEAVVHRGNLSRRGRGQPPALGRRASRNASVASRCAARVDCRRREVRDAIEDDLSWPRGWPVAARADQHARSSVTVLFRRRSFRCSFPDTSSLAGRAVWNRASHGIHHGEYRNVAISSLGPDPLRCCRGHFADLRIAGPVPGVANECPDDAVPDHSSRRAVWTHDGSDHRAGLRIAACL